MTVAVAVTMIGTRFQKEQQSERTRLLEGREYSKETSDLYDRSKQSVNEALDATRDTSTTLLVQRNQLERTRDDVSSCFSVGVGLWLDCGCERRNGTQLDETDSTLHRARGTLLRMGRRIVTSKLIMGTTILMELGAIGFLVYWRFFKS